MSIRRRLASFIVLMVGFLVIIGGILHLGRPIVEGAFRQSLDAMNSLNAIRELQFNINRQKSALNRFLLLDDREELSDFELASRISYENLETLEDRARSFLRGKVSALKESFESCQTIAGKVVEDYRSGKKSRAHDRWASDLFPAYQTLSKIVEALEKEQAQRAQTMFLKIKSLGANFDVFLMIILGLALLAGVGLFQSLYRAVMNPLEKLKMGAHRFGQGQFDYRINLSSKNEFGALADAFNTMAENVSQLQMQAVHMDRMSAVGQLAGGVAHEINNPLTAVLGQAQILLAKLPEDDPRVPQLKKIENAANRCRKIVRSLLDFSRPSKSQLEPVDVNHMIMSTIELCEADLKKSRVTVAKTLDVKIPPIRGNTSELQQVLLNLINNAIQAMSGGGTLTIETLTHNKKLKVTTDNKTKTTRVSSGPWVEIRVSDTGVGISQEHINRVFDPFFTTKDIGKGTGLGLSVSTGIIQKQGGRIQAESSGPNRGSTFIVTLSVKGPQGASKLKPGMAA